MVEFGISFVDREGDERTYSVCIACLPTISGNATEREVLESAQSAIKMRLDTIKAMESK